LVFKKTEIYQKFANYGLEHFGSDKIGVSTTRTFMLGKTKHTNTHTHKQTHTHTHTHTQTHTHRMAFIFISICSIGFN